jgi:hypothetical protein
MPSKRLMTAAELADLLGVQPAWVWQETRAGRIPSIRLGRKGEGAVMAEHLVSFMVEADTETEAVAIAEPFADNAIDVALWERGGGICWATREEQGEDELMARRRSYGTGSICVRPGSYYGRWPLGGRMVQRKFGPVRPPGGTTTRPPRQAAADTGGPPV